MGNSPRKEETKKEDYVVSPPVAVRQVEFVRPESLEVIRIITAKKEVILEDKQIEEKFLTLPPLRTTVEMRSEKHWYGNSETMRIHYFPLERSLHIASELQSYYKECGSVVSVNQTILFKKMREAETNSVRAANHFNAKVGEVVNFGRHMQAIPTLIQKIRDAQNRLALIELRLADFERVISVAEERAYYSSQGRIPGLMPGTSTNQSRSPPNPNFIHPLSPAPQGPPALQPRSPRSPQNSPGMQGQGIPLHPIQQKQVPQPNLTPPLSSPNPATPPLLQTPPTNQTPHPRSGGVSQAPTVQQTPQETQQEPVIEEPPVVQTQQVEPQPVVDQEQT